MLIATAALVGTVFGLGMSWPAIQAARTNHLANNAPVVAIAPSVASTLPVVQKAPEEPIASVTPPPAATSIAEATTPKPKKAAAKTRDPFPVSASVPTNDGTATKTQKPTKEEIARMQARLREFNADMEREAREKKAREAKP